MPTSSITEPFILESEEQAQALIQAIEESAKQPAKPEPISFQEIQSEEELREFLQRRAE